MTRWSTIEIHEIAQSQVLRVLDDPRRIDGDHEVRELTFCPGEERLLVARTNPLAFLFDLERGTRLAGATLPVVADGAVRRWPVGKVEGPGGELKVELGPEAVQPEAVQPEAVPPEDVPPEDVPPGEGQRDVFSPDGSRRIRRELTEYLSFRPGASQPEWRVAREGGWSQPGPASFSADGSLVGIISTPRAVTLVAAASGQIIATLRPPEPDPPRDLALSPSGRYVVVNYGWGTLFVWDLGVLATSLEALGVRGELPRLAPGPGPLPTDVQLVVRD